jgi:sensor histidine kinase YesM
VQFFFGVYSAQEPYHFLIGQEELSSVDIYGLRQTSNGTYWIASDNSLYAYDGYSFKNFYHQKQKSNSVFNLVESPEGIIYFNNLNGQLFSVRNNQIELVHEVPDSLISPYVSFSFLSSEEVLVHGRILYSFNLSNADEFKVLLSDGYSHLLRPAPIRMENGQVAINYWMDSLTFITEDEIKSYAIQGEDFLTFDKSVSLSYLEGSENKFYNQGFGVYELTLADGIAQFDKVYNGPGSLSRTYGAGGDIWVASSKSGVLRVDPDTGAEIPMFQDYFVSYVAEDQDNNILIGTFDNGMIVLPKSGMETVVKTEDINVSRMFVYSANEMYLGGKDGHIYTWDNGILDTIIKSGYKQIEFLEYFHQQQTLAFDKDHPVLYNFADQSTFNFGDGSAIKDICLASDSSYFLAGNEASYELSFSALGLSLIQIFDGRSYAIGFANDQLLIGSVKGLMLLTKGVEEEVLWKDQSVLVSSIVSWENGLLCGTKSAGVLLWKNGELQPFSNTNKGLKSNLVKSIHTWEKYLFVVTDYGIEILDQQGDRVGEVGLSDGLFSRKPNQLQIFEDDLYILQNEGIQRLHIPRHFEFQQRLSFQRIDFLVNDEVPLSGDLSFRANENNIAIELFVNAIAQSRDITYEYKLNGFEKDVHIQPYSQHDIVYNSLPPGKYTLTIDLCYKGEVQDSVTYNFEIDHPFYQKWWFYAIVLILVAILVALYFSYRIKKIKERNKEKLDRETLEKNALASQLKALRSQMNPHFIFNSLNSIQDLILQEDTDSSYDYIVLFSDLVRSTLNYSNQEFIDIDKELNFLEVYLSLEKLRFKEDFEYTIDYSGDQDILVPSLVVQPFIENALIHGLLHKEGMKKLTIRFEMDHQLMCVIEDNGIGRAKSKEINSRQHHKHDSFSLGAIKERMKILREQYGLAADYEIEDLFENGQSSGTRVVITMPFQKSY